MKSLSIAVKDTKVLFRDWKALMILLAMPFILISLLGMALGNLWSGEAGISKFDVGVVDQDKGELADLFISDVLKSKDMKKILTVSKMSEKTARAEVSSGDLAAAIIIPEGFSTKVTSGKDAKIEVLTDPGQEVRAGIVRSITGAYASRLSSVMIGAEVPIGTLMASGAVAPGQAETVIQEIIAEARKAAEKPKVTVGTASTARTRELSTIEYYSAGMSVMFIVFGCMFGAFSMLDERRQYTLMRLMSTPTGKATILGGKLGGVFLIGMLQFTALILATRFVFGVVWGLTPAVIALMMATVLATTGLTIFVAAVAKTRGMVAGISQLIIQLMALMGGSMIPLFGFPDWLRTAGKFTINYWAITGFRDLMLGKGFEAIVSPVLALVVIAVVFMTLGIARFRYE